jgi:hypothetical protein
MSRRASGLAGAWWVSRGVNSIARCYDAACFFLLFLVVILFSVPDFPDSGWGQTSFLA